MVSSNSQWAQRNRVLRSMFLNEKMRILGLVTVRVAFKWARLYRGGRSRNGPDAHCFGAQRMEVVRYDSATVPLRFIATAQSCSRSVRLNTANQAPTINIAVAHTAELISAG